jgi:serine/threonine protein kinase
LASGHAPFETKDENVTYDKIVKSECKFPQYFSKQLREIIGKILDKRPEKRPNLEQIESDQWFEKYKGVGRYISKDIWSSWEKIQ